jgi:hypothetical protein
MSDGSALSLSLSFLSHNQSWLHISKRTTRTLHGLLSFYLSLLKRFLKTWIKKHVKDVLWSCSLFSLSAQNSHGHPHQKELRRRAMVCRLFFYSYEMYIPVSKLLQGFLMALLSPFWQTIYTKHIYQPLNTLVQKQLHKQPMSAPPVRRDFQATLSKSHTNIPMFFLPPGLYIISRMVQIPCVVLCVYLHCPSARK